MIVKAQRAKGTFGLLPGGQKQIIAVHSGEAVVLV